MAAGLEIIYRTTTRTRTGPGVRPVRDDVAQGRLTLLCGDDAVAIGDEMAVRVWDYREQKRLKIDLRKRSYERCSLCAVVHERVSALASVAGVYEVLRAGKAEAPGDIADAEAFYGVRASDKAPAVQHELDPEGGELWLVAGAEVARVRWSEQPLAQTSLRRVLVGGLPLHPAVGADIAARARVPNFVRVTCPFFFEATVTEWTFESIRACDLDVASLCAGSELGDALDESHAIARRVEPRAAGSARLEAARANVAANRLIEGLLAAFAHALATGHASSELLRIIQARASWWTPARRFLRRMASDKPSAADFSGFEKHAGGYGHVLDVFGGERLAGSGRTVEGEQALKRALARDPGLTAVWVSLGELYAQRREFTAAWDCFDYARALCPSHPVVIEKVVRLERALRAEHPQMF